MRTPTFISPGRTSPLNSRFVHLTAYTWHLQLDITFKDVENGHGLDPQPVLLVICFISLNGISVLSAAQAKKPDIILDPFILLHSICDLISSKIDYFSRPPLHNSGPSHYTLTSFIAEVSRQPPCLWFAPVGLFQPRSQNDLFKTSMFHAPRLLKIFQCLPAHFEYELSNFDGLKSQKN